LRAFPGLRVIVPHLGMDEYREYRDLLLSHEGLYLDTAMAVGGYFGNEPPVDELEDISERIVYGSDFPNLPYPYERELEALRSSGLSQAALLRITGENAAALFGRA